MMRHKVAISGQEMGPNVKKQNMALARIAKIRRDYGGFLGDDFTLEYGQDLYEKHKCIILTTSDGREYRGVVCSYGIDFKDHTSIYSMIQEGMLTSLYDSIERDYVKTLPRMDRMVRAQHNSVANLKTK